MIRFLTSKSVVTKIVIAIILVTIINFTLAPTFSHANLAQDISNIFLELFLNIGDGAMWLAHSVVFGFSESMHIIQREDIKVSRLEEISCWTGYRCWCCSLYCRNYSNRRSVSHSFRSGFSSVYRHRSGCWN
jgi:hypothetical protein